MTIEFAKFTAEVAKGIKIGSDVEVKLLIPLKSAVPFLEFLSNSQGQDVMVHLGDPQAAFDFEDQESDPMYNTWNGGRRVTTDSSGVVTQIVKPGSEPEQDENQAQLFGPVEAPIDKENPIADGKETIEGNGQSTVPPTGSDGDGTPDWLSEGSEDQSGSKEMDFTSEGGEGEPKSAVDPQHVTQEDPPAGDKANPPAEIGKEELELFILNQRPIFDDIKLADAPADFPALLQQRNSGKTWMEISKEINVPSGQISTKYGLYKKRVTKMMQDGVAV
ncbi:hypothetical protein [Paenibacillus sp. M2]|uniref:hypothetical protein n=1 Tax=Paenibacillus sp. M2 TaxID=3341793 RepID=UPI00398A2B0B